MKLKLGCYFPADEPLFFTIPIDSDDNVATLIKAVYEELKDFGQDTKRKELSLYQTDIPMMPDGDLCMRALQWLHEQPLQAHLKSTTRLTTLFPAVPSLDTLHILVADPSVTEMLATLGEPDARYSRKLQKALSKAITNLSPHFSPSEVVKEADRVKEFLDPAVGRVYLDRVPVAMFSPPLATLQKRLNNLDSVEVSCTDVDRAVDLFGAAIRVYADEKQRQESILKRINLLVEGDGKWEQPLRWADGIKPGATWWRQIFAIILLELKNTVGIGGDAMLQATAVYSKIIPQDRFRHYQGTCNFPVVLIGVSGNRIQVSAAVCTGTIYVSSLYLLDLTTGFHSSQNIIQLARVFKAVSLCRRELETYYDGVLNPPNAAPLLSALFPRPTLTSEAEPPVLVYRKFLARSGQPISEIPKLGSMTTAMYIATRGDTDEEVIVKFTARYNEEAHTLLDNAGLAPKLYACHRIIGDLYMVVMERVVGQTLLQLCRGEPGIPTTVVDQVEKAVNLLHENDIVFGDLRDNNILYTQVDGSAGGKVSLVDFDWSDKAGEGRYPAALNVENTWADQVKAYGCMQKADDLWQVDRLRKLCVQDSS